MCEDQRLIRYQPISAMAAVTKNLGFAVTVSTTYEAPYTLARRLSTLDHLTKGRIGWNIVTSFKESGAKAVSYHTLHRIESMTL